MKDEKKGKQPIKQKLSEIYDKATLENYKEELFLKLNDETKYNLVDLEELEEQEKDSKEYQKYRDKFSKITNMDVSNNSLAVLNLKNYNFLEKITATKNKIIKVELVLQKLTYINLSNNMLTKIFELNSVPNLQTLNLSHNSILKVHYEDFKPVKFTLKTVQLDHNKINFDSVKEFIDFFELFGKNIKQIVAFGISMNPFTMETIYNDYYSYILASFANVEFKILNGKTISQDDKDKVKDAKELKERILSREKDDSRKNELKKKEVKTRSKTSVTISFINGEMEKYTTLGKLNQESLHSLFELIESYILNSGVGVEKDEESSGQFEDTELEEFENFLEYSNILIDSSPSLEKKLFEIVADFTMIKSGKFAYLILAFLKQQFSPTKANDITDVIMNKIINIIVQTPDKEGINPSLIKGLESFLTESKFFEIMKGMLKKILRIMLIYRGVNILGGNKNAEENRKKEIFCNCVSFLSIASISEDYLEIIVRDDNSLDSFASQIRILINEKEDVLNKDLKALEILQRLLN